MNPLRLKGRSLAAAVALAFGAGLGHVPAATAAEPPPADTTGVVRAAASTPHDGPFTPLDAAGRGRYIVILDDAPLASYDGGKTGLARVPRLSTAQYAGRPDVNSTQAAAYVDYLRSTQDVFVADAAKDLKRNVRTVARFQHAINAVALDLTADEAEQLRRRPGVRLVNRERVRTLDTYATPALIGATSVWNGAATPGGIATKGEGIVVGIIDSGINWASDSFRATGDDNYTHVNPLGAGTYLGQCRAGGPDVGHCNDKLIGIYNFVDPQASGRDLNGHGSHTASTAAGGNVTAASYAGGTFNLSGIAPHANVIAYLGCCSDVGLVSSVNQTVADGIVDVVNYSIGGATPGPWNDTVDLAFLGAVNAGIFVAKSAGNDGPGLATAANSAAPWETTVAATTSSRVPAFQFSLTAPLGAANTVNIAAKPGATPTATQAYVNLPLIESPNFADGSNDGCAAYPANAFRRGGVAGGAQGIAVLHLDQNASNCGSGARRTRAADAGALAVVYVDPQFINLGASGASYSVLLSAWNAIKATPGIDVTANGNATATLGYPIADGARPPDDIADFSSRGPAPYAVLKPDLAAPGVDILAAKSPTVAGGYDAANLAATRQIYALDSGTSMASPHVAGAAALLRAVNRSWTPMEVRSALTTTAVPVLDEDNATTSHPNTAGAGRIDLTRAAKAGLLFDETYANFLAADPAQGGRPETLNIASIYHHDCTGICTFKRTVRSGGKAGTWAIAVTGLPAGSYSLDKTSFVIGSTGRTSFSLTVDTQNLVQGQWYYGQLTLTSSNADVPVARLPIAIRPSTSKLRADVDTVEATAVAGASVERTITVSNPGNPGLNWSVAQARLTGTIVDRRPIGTGFPVRTIGVGNAVTSNDANNLYGADYFDIYGNGSRLAKLEIGGFAAQRGDTLPGLASQLAWRVYLDNAANEPDGTPGDAVLPIFAFNSAPSAAGVAYGNNVREGAERVSLDVAAAGAPPVDLATARYWFSMTPTMSAANNGGGRRWYWFLSSEPNRAPVGQVVFPNDTDPQYASWYPLTDEDPDYTGWTMKIDIDAACSAPWLRYGSTAGTLAHGGSAPITVTFDATGLAPATYKAYVCVSGNGTSPTNDVTEDADTKLIPVTFTVTELVDGIFADDFE